MTLSSLSRQWSIGRRYIRRRFAQKAEMAVWAVLYFCTPLISLMMWLGARGITSTSGHTVTISYLTSYFLMTTVVSSFTDVGIEGNVSTTDIKEGKLAQYLLKPYPYVLTKFWAVLSFRLPMCVLSVVAIWAISLALELPPTPLGSPLSVILSLVILLLGFMIAFYFKMCIGFLAFWTVNNNPVIQVITALGLILGGPLLPLDMLPGPIYQLALWLPPANYIYLPTLSFLGQLTIRDQLGTVGYQLVLLTLFHLLYRYMWRKGVMKFTSSGQ